mgnify:CR=1 FL=1
MLLFGGAGRICTWLQMGVHILQIELDVPMVSIPHLRDNRDLLIMVINRGNGSVHLLQRLIQEVHILDDAL